MLHQTPGMVEHIIYIAKGLGFVVLVPIAALACVGLALLLSRLQKGPGNYRSSHNKIGSDP